MLSSILIFAYLMGGINVESEPIYMVGYKDGLPYLFEAKIAGLDRDRKPQYLQAPAADSFQDMALAAQRQGIELIINYGFRSNEEQRRLRKLTPRLAMRAGHSPHQEGISVDVANIKRGNKAFKWLKAHANDYGFYSGRRDEPWHFDFNGRSKVSIENNS